MVIEITIQKINNKQNKKIIADLSIKLLTNLNLLKI